MTTPRPTRRAAVKPGLNMTPTRVVAIRTEAGLTQTELAELLRMSDRRTVRRWEKGEVPVTGPASILLELLASGELPTRYQGLT
jgi:DNA-binding transcriptional regulator YiaG